MSTRGHVGSAVFLAAQQIFPDQPVEKYHQMEDFVCNDEPNSPFNRAFQFGQSCQIDEDTELIEKIKRSNESARKLALVSYAVIENSNVDNEELFNKFLDVHKEWQENYIKGDDE